MPIPHKKSPPLVGDFFSMMRDPLGFFRGVFSQHGDLVRLRLGPTEMLLVANPTLARALLKRDVSELRRGTGHALLAPLMGNSLFLTEGENWIARRKLIQPLLQPAALERISEPVRAATEAAVSTWRDGQRDLWEEVRNLSLSLGGELLLGSDRFAGEPELRDRVNRAWLLANRRQNPLVKLFTLDGTLRFRREVRALRSVVSQIDAQGGALVERLRAAGLDQATRRDEMITLALAAQECSALVVTWALYLLARHPEAQQRARAEPRFLKAVINESLRLYPPAWILSRETLREMEVEGVRLGASEQILFSLYLIHRHPDFWDEPERFLPERFLNEPGRTASAFMPFGVGPRTCVGSHYASQQAMLMLEVFLRRARFLPAGPADVMAGLSLRPRDGVPLRVSLIGRSSPHP